MNKMTLCCLKLEEWDGGLVREMKSKMASYKSQIHRQRSGRDNQGVDQYNAVRWEYLCLLEKQEIYWQQRAKQYWLTEGDKNSRFFHKYASNQRRNNMIKGLNDSNRVWKEANTDVQGIITEYFTSLFQSVVPDGRLGEGDTVLTISENQNQSLLVPVTEAEVKAAVFAMHPDKSPSPDGLNPAFSQMYWPIVGADVVQFVKVISVLESCLGI